MADDASSPHTPDSQETGEFAVRPIVEAAQVSEAALGVDAEQPARSEPAAHPAWDAPQPKLDKWAHRRGEPRMLVLFWSVYLMASAIVTVFSVRLLGPPSQSAFRPAAQSLLTLAGIGVGVLWPMVRLSQAAPMRPLRAALADIVAISLPVQAIVWPTRLLTAWAWSIVGGVALMLFAWTILMSALIAAATSTPVASRQEIAAPSGGATAPILGLPQGRVVWMLACLCVAAGVPLVMLLGGLLGVAPSPVGWLASPITASFALTDAPSGLSARMAPEEWAATAAPGVVGLMCFAALRLGGTLSRRGKDPGGAANSGLQ